MSGAGMGGVNAEQKMLSDSVARFAAAHRGANAIEQDRGGPSWREMADLGWLGIGLPEAGGGYGGSFSDQTVILTDLGYGLSLQPYVMAVTAGISLVASLCPGHAILSPLIDGQNIAIPALLESDRVFRPLETDALLSGSDEAVLVGAKAVVGDADLADWLIASCRVETTGELAIVLLRADAPGVRMAHRTTFAGNVVTQVVFDKVAVAKADILASGAASEQGLSEAVVRTTIGWCAMAAGAARMAFDQTLDFVKVRRQFGRPIGEFQALQHRLADMYIAVTEADALVDMAAVQIDAGGPIDRQRATSLARSGVFRRTLLVAREAVQLHGGMGMTEEMIVGRAFRYIKMLDISAGT